MNDNIARKYGLMSGYVYEAEFRLRERTRSTGILLTCESAYKIAETYEDREFETLGELVFVPVKRA